MKNFFIDLEFTGLDNTFISDNEIIQLKIKEEGKKSRVYFFGSNKPSTAGAFICHRIHDDIRKEASFFSEEKLKKILKENNVSEEDNLIFFGNTMDIKMMSKYNIILKNNIIDIQNELMLIDEYEYLLATEGRSLETCYYIVTKEIPMITCHGDEKELILMEEIYSIIKDKPQNLYLQYVPWGHCAGMDLSDYAYDYRRNADGYRYNNNDLFARSLDNLLEEDDEDEY